MEESGGDSAVDGSRATVPAPGAWIHRLSTRRRVSAHTLRGVFCQAQLGGEGSERLAQDGHAAGQGPGWHRGPHGDRRWQQGTGSGRMARGWGPQGAVMETGPRRRAMHVLVTRPSRGAAAMSSLRCVAARSFPEVPQGAKRRQFPGTGRDAQAAAAALLGGCVSHALQVNTPGGRRHTCPACVYTHTYVLTGVGVGREVPGDAACRRQTRAAAAVRPVPRTRTAEETARCRGANVRQEGKGRAPAPSLSSGLRAVTCLDAAHHAGEGDPLYLRLT